MWLNRDSSRCSGPLVCLPEATAAADEDEAAGADTCVASCESSGEVLGEIHVSLRGGVACIANSKTLELNVVLSLTVRKLAQAMRLMLPTASFENLCIAAGTQNHACTNRVVWCSGISFSACVVVFCCSRRATSACQFQPLRHTSRSVGCISSSGRRVTQVASIPSILEPKCSFTFIGYRKAGTHRSFNFSAQSCYSFSQSSLGVPLTSENFVGTLQLLTFPGFPWASSFSTPYR
jgi:hypothetical protein